MTSLVELFAAGPAATTLHFRERVAEDIVYLIGPALEQFILSRLPPNLAEEAYQETLIAIVTRYDQCCARTEPGIWAWCYGIARFKIADQWRQLGPLMASLDVEVVRRAVESSLRVEAAGVEEADELQYALALLGAAKPPCVVYLWEAFALELSYVEMGRLHGKKPDAMRMQVERCLKLAQRLVVRKAKVKHV